MKRPNNHDIASREDDAYARWQELHPPKEPEQGWCIEECGRAASAYYETGRCGTCERATAGGEA